MKLPTPSWQKGSTVIVDAKGRRIEMRRELTLADTARLLKAIPPKHQKNEALMSLIMTGVMVAKIDDEVISVPVNQRQINILLDKLGNEGFAALTELVARQIEEFKSLCAKILEQAPAPKQFDGWIKLQDNIR